MRRTVSKRDETAQRSRAHVPKETTPTRGEGGKAVLLCASFRLQRGPGTRILQPAALYSVLQGFRDVLASRTPDDGLRGPGALQPTEYHGGRGREDHPLRHAQRQE